MDTNLSVSRKMISFLMVTGYIDDGMSATSLSLKLVLGQAEEGIHLPRW